MIYTTLFGRKIDFSTLTPGFPRHGEIIFDIFGIFKRMIAIEQHKFGFVRQDYVLTFIRTVHDFARLSIPFISDRERFFASAGGDVYLDLCWRLFLIEAEPLFVENGVLDQSRQLAHVKKRIKRYRTFLFHPARCVLDASFLRTSAWEFTDSWFRKMGITMTQYRQLLSWARMDADAEMPEFTCDQIARLCSMNDLYLRTTAESCVASRKTETLDIERLLRPRLMRGEMYERDRTLFVLGFKMHRMYQRVKKDRQARDRLFRLLETAMRAVYLDVSCYADNFARDFLRALNRHPTGSAAAFIQQYKRERVKMLQVLDDPEVPEDYQIRSFIDALCQRYR